MIALKDHERIEFEPEVFPGLVCRISESKIVYLFFSSKKIIITCGKNMDVKKNLPSSRKNSELLPGND